MSYILVPATNFTTPSGFYAKEPNASTISHQYRVGDYSNTLVKRFIDPNGGYVSSLFDDKPANKGLGLRCAIDNDPDNSFMCVSYVGGTGGSSVFWQFDETALDDNRTPFLKGKPRAVYVKTDTAFFDTDTSNYYIYQFKRGLSVLTLSGISPTYVYGDGTIHASGVATYPQVSDEILEPAQTIMYFSSDVVHNYFSFFISAVGSVNANNFIQQLVYGVLYTLPENEIFERVTNYSYQGTIDYTELGKPILDSLHSPGVKRSFNLQFDYLDEDEMNGLRDVFVAGKGGLPMLYIGDLDDTDTWIYCTISTMAIEEPQPCYFTVSLNLEEI